LVAVTYSSTRSASGIQPILNVKLPLAGIVGVACAGMALMTMARHGFDDAGLRLASELAWRFASIVFFAAVVAGPLCRLIPYTVMKPLNRLRRQLIWSFSASYAVFLAVMLLPNTLGGVAHDDATFGMTLFALFGGGAAGVMAYTAGREAASRLGEKIRRAFLSVAGSFFWLTYALTGLAHLSGPHRPDGFYGFSLSLMILALLLRFTDRFVAKLRGTSETSLPA
jgi:branched-subunit amino acid transport protein AzlD